MLSNDSNGGRRIGIKLSINSKEKEVAEFLRQLHMLLDNPDFDIDKDNTEPPLLYVFGKEINDRLVYIKLKIKEAQKKYVLCVSFHYAEKEMRFPYI